jgi:hypothetical protein
MLAPGCDHLVDGSTQVGLGVDQELGRGHHLLAAVEAVKDLDELKASHRSIKKTATKKPKRIYIRMADTGDTDRLESLKRHVVQHPGTAEVVLVVGPAERRQAIRIPDRSDDSQESVDKLVSLFGGSNVICE